MHTHTKIHTLSGIRTHNPSFRASEDSACLRPLRYCDWPIYEAPFSKLMTLCVRIVDHRSSRLGVGRKADNLALKNPKKWKPDGETDRIFKGRLGMAPKWLFCHRRRRRRWWWWWWGGGGGGGSGGVDYQGVLAVVFRFLHIVRTLLEERGLFRTRYFPPPAA
jgi:hypothetical protein